MQYPGNINENHTFESLPKFTYGLMVHKPLISALLKYFVDYQLNSNVYVIDLYIYKRVKTDKCTIAISHILNCLAGY